MANTKMTIRMPLALQEEINLFCKERGLLRDMFIETAININCKRLYNNTKESLPNIAEMQKYKGPDWTSCIVNVSIAVDTFLLQQFVLILKQTRIKRDIFVIETIKKAMATYKDWNIDPIV